MSFRDGNDDVNEIDFYGPLASQQRDDDDEDENVHLTDYTEGADDNAIETVGLDIAHRRRASQIDNLNDEYGGSIFSGPDNASIPSSAISFRHGFAGSSQARRPSLDRRPSADRRGSSASVFSEGSDSGSGRPLYRRADRSASRTRARRDSNSSANSPLLETEPERPPLSTSKNSGVFSGIASIFAGRNDDDTGRRRPPVSRNSSAAPGASDGSAVSDTDWGYSSNEEISDDNDTSSEMASSAAASLNNSESSSAASSRRRRSNEFMPTGTFAADPVFGDTRIPMELSQEETINPDAEFLTKASQSGDQSRQRIYIQEEDVTLLVTGFRASPFGHLLWCLGVLLTLGTLALIGRWTPALWLRWAAIEAPFTSHSDRKEATFVVIETQFGHVNLYDIESMPFPFPMSHIFPHDTTKSAPSTSKVKSADTIESGTSSDSSSAGFIRFFDYRYTKFILNDEQGVFRMIRDWRDPRWISQGAVAGGLSESKREERRALFGLNEIEIEERSWGQLFVDEVLHPFYVFQVASIVLWSIDDYYYYAFCIAVISISSIFTTLIETKRTVRRMKEMSKYSCAVWLKSNNEWKVVESSTLQPGDIFDAADPNLHTVPCDAILLNGDAIVNESMLTGESVPVAKVPISDSILRTYAKSEPKGTTDISPSLARHFMYSGTKIVRVRGEGVLPNGQEGPALALVTRTGFNTTKGALVRSMLFPKPMGFKFYKDSMNFIGVLAGIAFLGFLASSVNFIKLGIAWHTIMVRALDLITVVVPPALPATMSIGTSFAISRLRKKGVFCISPTRVNVGGKINVVCFDKTGTLTEDGLDVLGIRSKEDATNRFSELYQDASDIPLEKNHALLYALVTCHSLKLVDDQVIGDPLDIKMFENTNWTLEEGKIGSQQRSTGTTENNHTDKKGKSKSSRIPKRPSALVQTIVRPPGGKTVTSNSSKSFLELGVIRTFDFVSSLRRMSVIVKKLKSQSMEVYVKGAPESMAEICDKDSFPEDYDDLLSYYTKHGYRVIALAGKSIPGLTWIKAQRMKREQAESGLQFLGLIIFENKLKPGTTPAISTLRQAHLAIRMVTGDNPRTAISVARECGLIGVAGHVFIPTFVRGTSEDPAAQLEWSSADDDKLKLDSYSLRPFLDEEDDNSELNIEYQDYHLAVTGDVFRWMMEFSPLETLERMLVKSQIFSRMSPDQKCELVERLQQLGYTVGFCGDGANDCGALKAADVGLSLSEAEASVAAPFTSNTPDISCFIEVLKEGRSALVTSFSCFKYMALYSLIQFTSITLLYSFASSLGDFQFLAIDLAIILPIAVTMGRTLPYPSVHPKRPTANLVSKKVLTSIIGQTVICSAIQFFVFFDVRRQPWYEPPEVNVDKLETRNYENSAIFIVSCFQYVLVALVFSVGPPFRQPLYTNLLFLLTLVVLFGCAVVILFLPSGAVFELLELMPFPWSYHLKLLGIVLVNVLVSLTYEKYAEKKVAKYVGSVLRSWRHWRRGDYSQSRKAYKHVEGNWRR
ncbi:hypothetical protein E3P88_01870 [Wallemia ichthyophaga]|uniref:Cation-transporting ATPase n=1 Tax=Wallemia ichthyophaga TaxID=245174 RepID=A0A4T0I6L5_WALIC|nr:hypothetical protein E3P95_00309 [Wallemia ichthyophaga]TIB05324.1 hypothetical protein E3P94_00309 [Wallemia ichthyophaga]TIB12780.1 hypothetical protein E3P90_01915 [Wallemia ichthyophaga]TIB14375.1 hypothetical protein E3P93_01665 [Wallemia ichthyophaga]TIB24956.1 hypothetical protein E3P88_01870 [Wallemia ichthyophaga]